jgi:hypothetical protein
MYVSCRFAPPPDMEGVPQQIICTDENGAQWWLTEDSLVGDWLEYQKNGGEITPYEEAE